MRRITVAAVFVLIAMAATVNAQQGTGDLRGKIVDSQQAVMPGVTVTVRNQENGTFRTTVSGVDGSYFVSAMNPGVYQVEAMLDGFRPYERKEVRLEVGRTITVDVTLELGGIEERLTVTAEAPLVDTTSKEVGGHVSAEEFVNTPSLNRSFSGFLGMVPGIVSTVSTSTFGGDTISVGGQGARNVAYTMDGSDNNDGLTGGGTSSQARVPIEAVQEFKVLTSQFDAEYGGTSGAIVNAVSKSGTNIFHGSGFAFYQDQNLSSQNYFAKKSNLTEAPTTMQQYGGTVGGPIVRDKMHFFFSLERILFDNGVTVNVPTRPDLNRNEFGVSRNWNTFIRLDNQLNSSNTWGVRWLREASPQPKQVNETWTALRNAEETDVDQTFVGTLSSVIGSTRVNTLRLSYTSEILHFANPTFLDNGFDQQALLPTLVHPSFEDGQSPTADIRRLFGYTVDDSFSWFVPNRAGDHELKFGMLYSYIPLHFRSFTNENGTFSFSRDPDFNAADPFTYPERLMIRVPGESEYRMHGTYGAAYAQDRWKMGNNFTLSVGIRYDAEFIPTPNGDNPLFEGRDNDYPKDLNNFSPRVGFSYALDSEGKSAMHGGFGLFYQRTVLTPLTPMVASGRYTDSFIANFPLNNIDPGPRSGRLPTDPMLVNGPTVNRALLDQLYPSGTLARNTGTVRFDNPDRDVPWTRQYSVGYTTQLGPSLAVGVDFIRSESRRQFVLLDLNPPLRANQLATGAVTRTNPLVGSVGEFAGRVDTLVNAGSADYNSVQFSANKRFSKGYTARVSYAYSNATGNTTAGNEGASNSQYLGDLRLDAEEGPTSVDRPHILSASGSWDVPKTKGLRVSGIVSARSGLPYTLLNTAVDMDQNGSTANEYLAPGTYSGVGDDALTVDYEGGRNGAYGPAYVTVDMRAGYRINMPGGRTLDAFLDIFNATDRANFNTPANDIRIIGTFMKVTSTIGATRTAQLNFRYGF